MGETGPRQRHVERAKEQHKVPAEAYLGIDVTVLVLSDPKNVDMWKRMKEYCDEVEGQMPDRLEQIEFWFNTISMLPHEGLWDSNAWRAVDHLLRRVKAQSAVLESHGIGRGVYSSNVPQWLIEARWGDVEALQRIVEEE